MVARLRLHGSEGEDVEAKASKVTLPRSVIETLSAYSNDRGGILILGLSETQGFAATGVDNPKKIMDDLASMCSDNLEPPVRADLATVTFEDVTLVVGVVSEIGREQKPCYVKDKGPYTGSFTRTGDGDRRLTQYEVGLLFSNRGQPTYDAEAVPDTGLEDLDPTAVSALLGRVRERQPAVFVGANDVTVLQRLKVLVRHETGLVPSLGGLLALGKYPQQYFPQLHVSFISIPAKAKDQIPADGPRFLDNQTMVGSIPVMVEETLRVITRNMSTRATVSGAGREEAYDYPLEALREAVVNSLLHRDYSPGARGSQIQIEMYQDRLIIRNPGGLYGTVTEEDLGGEGVSSSRNAYLSALLMETAMPGGQRLVAENRGSGIPAMLATLRRAGMTTPVFLDRIGNFTLTFPKHSLLGGDTLMWLEGLGSGLTEFQRMALALMRDGRAVTNASLQRLGCDSRNATAALTGLVERGLAISRGGRRYAEYELFSDATGLSSAQLLLGADEPPRDAPRTGSRTPRVGRLQQVMLLFTPGIILSAAEVGLRLGISGRSASTYLAALISAQKIEATAPPKSPQRRYRLTDAGRSSSD